MVQISQTTSCPAQGSMEAAVSQAFLKGIRGFAHQKSVTAFVLYPAGHENDPVLRVTLLHVYLKTFNFQIWYGGRGAAASPCPGTDRCPACADFPFRNGEHNGHIMCLVTAVNVLWAATAVTSAAIATNYSSGHGGHFQRCSVVLPRKNHPATPASDLVSRISSCIKARWT